jgi:N-acetylglucosaminyldiphosphoundecaprenol N-acetyl-beta-D-mannosaminyltransferase
LRFNISKIEINVTDLPKCLDSIREALNQGNYGYICVTNVRTAWLANQDPEYLKIQNGSLLTVPDGMPLVWYAHRRGFKNVGRVSGLSLMKGIFSISSEEKYSHYFYGSTPDTIVKLVKNVSENYPGISIKKAVSPPFQPVEKINAEELAAEINLLQPEFFWVGLGAPKQSYLMAKLQPLLKSTICIGVGLCFEYLSGNVKRAPEWMQRAGLEWLFRVAQQPRNIGRIIKPFSWFAGMYVLTFFNHKGHKGFH